MVGWVGSPLQHEICHGSFTDQSWCQFWLKIDPLWFCVWGGMPAIAPTDLAELGVRAQSWVERCDRLGRLTRPSQLTIDQRREDSGAAAAFSIVTFRNVDYLQACATCGLWTASWCEGCYARAVCDRSLAFSPICTLCDQEQLVCQDCVEHGASWQTGHIAYETHFADTAIAEVLASTEDNGSGVFQVFDVREPTGSNPPAGRRSARPADNATPRSGPIP